MTERRKIVERKNGLKEGAKERKEEKKGAHTEGGDDKERMKLKKRKKQKYM